MLDFDADEIQEKKDRIDEERKKIRERDLSDIKKILDLPEGRRFLWRVLSEAKVFISCFNDNNTTMAYLEGRRDVGLFVLNELTTANKNALSKIQNEYFSESGKNKRSK
jgi:hypothetical protein